MSIFSSVTAALALSALSLNAAEFIGAPEPKTGEVSPVAPAEQQKRFTLPPGFEVELVASEEQGIGKPITVAWDDAGRIWTITALEYPLDGNEQPEAARALYEKGGQDRVLVIDNPYAAQPGQPRVFADGLAMPMGILPYKDGALVGHGPDVLFLHDTDGDGRADQREVVLTGFGVQDSHLMPHQFTRAPGGWFYLAQGAFNYSRVKTRDGREHQFDQTRLARFTADGMHFESLTSGPCNIWGLVIGREGETFIQEANDFGYPVMAFHAGASYPGCSGAFKPYAPYFPSEVEFRMGGTGLSGLALSDPKGSFPGPYADVMFVANPITRKVQAIKIHRDGPWHRYEMLPDFMLSSDEWFRPVAIHFGPDGALYVIDWYNKIISHNEVPRTHPERDKTRGRIWRIRHKDQSRAKVPDIAKAPANELMRYLQSDSTWQMRAAWHQIADRKLTNLAPELLKIVRNRSASAAHRVHALWTLEELKALPLEAIRELLREENRNLRREAIRSLSTLDFTPTEITETIEPFTSDPDPEVRAEVIRVAALHAGDDRQALAILEAMAKGPLDSPIGKNPQNGAPMKLREAYDREFERYLIRAALERIPEAVQNRLFLDASVFLGEPALLFALSLPGERAAETIARALIHVPRLPTEEELLRVVENLHSEAARMAIAKIFRDERSLKPLFEALLKVRNRINSTNLAALPENAVKALWESGDKEFAARVAGAFGFSSITPDLRASLRDSGTAPRYKIAALRALRELGQTDLDACLHIIANEPDRAVRDEALNSIASASNDHAAGAMIDSWRAMNPVQRRAAMAHLTSAQPPARELLGALRLGRVDERALDDETLRKLDALFPGDGEVRALVERLSQEFKPVLRLDGEENSWVDSNITLDGPFTVETWVRLDPGISNVDGILGVPGGADFNFAGGQFRVWCGSEFGDRAIARKAMLPETWTHIAVTRDESGRFKVYINGELDVADDRPVTVPLKDLDIGRTIASPGTAGELTEYRIWNIARSADEIRADFSRSFAGEPKPAALVHYFPAEGSWGTLHGKSRVVKVSGSPVFLTAAEARKQEERFARFLALAEREGNLEKGRELFTSACSACHSVGGQGGQIGPVLNGAAANGVETMLRAILAPNAAMEAGYRTFRVELKDGDILDGFLVSQDSEAIILRQPNLEDQRIPADSVRRAGYTRNSLMPDGLLESLSDQEAQNLLAYLKTLK